MTASTIPLYPRNENDYILEYIKIVSYNGKEYDFSAHFVEFTFEESIFEVGLHGFMFVRDSVDYPTLMPLIGEERIKAKFTRQNEKEPEGGKLPPIEFDLQVYMMEGKQETGYTKKRQTYTLYYGSDLAFNNINAKVCKAYKDVPYSEMVTDLYKSHLNLTKPLIVEETEGRKNYIVQNVSPVDAIKKLAQRSISANDKNGSFYVFYEDRDNVYFVTLAHLIKEGQKVSKKDKIVYKYRPKNLFKVGTAMEHKERNIEEDLYSVQYLHRPESFDILRSALSGEATSSLFTIDPIRRKRDLKALDLRGAAGVAKHGIELLPNSTWDDFAHVEKAKPWTDNNKMFINPLTNMYMVLTDKGQEEHPYITPRDSTIRPYDPERFLAQRKSQKMQFLKNVITTTVSGDPRIRAGMIINFNIPEHMGKLGKHAPEELDKYVQGDYLVVGVSHSIKNGRYTMNLELLKDSYFSQIQHRNPVEEYKDIF